MPKDDELLTTGQVAKLLNVSKSTVLRYVRTGHLTGAVRLPSGYLRVPRSAVDRLLEQGREDVRLDRPPGAGPGAMAATCPICGGELGPQRGGDPRSIGYCPSCQRFV